MDNQTPSVLTRDRKVQIMDFEEKLKKATKECHALEPLSDENGIPSFNDIDGYEVIAQENGLNFEKLMSHLEYFNSGGLFGKPYKQELIMDNQRLETLTKRINALREEIKQQEFNVNSRLASREYFPLLQAAEILNKASLELEDLEIEFLDLMTPSEELPNE